MESCVSKTDEKKSPLQIYTSRRIIIFFFILWVRIKDIIEVRDMGPGLLGLGPSLTYATLLLNLSLYQCPHVQKDIKIDSCCEEHVVLRFSLSPSLKGLLGAFYLLIRKRRVLKFEAGRWSRYSGDYSFNWVTWVSGRLRSLDYRVWISVTRKAGNLASYQTHTLCLAFV